jgi:hypothetical protein
MESYAKELLRVKVINRILKCSEEYSKSHLDKLSIVELFEVQSLVFRDMLINSRKSSTFKLKQTH